MRVCCVCKDCSHLFYCNSRISQLEFLNEDEVQSLRELQRVYRQENKPIRPRETVQSPAKGSNSLINFLSISMFWKIFAIKHFSLVLGLCLLQFVDKYHHAVMQISFHTICCHIEQLHVLVMFHCPFTQDGTTHLCTDTSHFELTLQHNFSLSDVALAHYK